jgi:hypothetical protein
MKKKKKKRRGGMGVIRVILFVAALCVFLYSAYQLYIIYHGYAAADAEYEGLADEFTKPVGKKEPDSTPTPTPTPQPVKSEEGQVVDIIEDAEPPVEVDWENLKAINPDINIVKHEIYLSEDNALELIRPYDFVIDGTDNFATKYLVNDACVMLQKSFCMGGISKYAGQVMTHRPGTACYRCLFPEPPAISEVETCAMVGVLGSIAGMLGTVQATEAIKCLAGVGEPLFNALLTFDALTMNWQRFEFPKNEGCALCGNHPTITRLKEYAFQPCSKKK